MNSSGKVEINSGVQSQTIEIHCEYGGMAASKQIVVAYDDNQLDIECASPIVGTSGNAIATYNSAQITPTWSIDEGQQYVAIDNSGNLTISASGNAVIKAEYNGYSRTKSIEVQYQANTSSHTTVDEDGSVTTETETVVTNPDGSTTTTTTSMTVHEDGFASTTESTLIEDEDGSSTLNATTSRQDGTSSVQEKQTAVDGSSQSTTTEYDADGTATAAVNEDVDVSGNASTQNISYDSNGDPVITGYAIDTSGSQEGQKEFDMDGVNTEFYGFDSVAGFTLDLHFTIDFTDQPPNQDEGHHNILSMKRAAPEPWYGLQLRQSNANKYVQLGTQFYTGSTTNKTVSPAAANWVVENKIAEFNFQITYDPTLASNNFVCRELISNRSIYSASNVFPDIPELRYLTVCVGYALDANAQPFRYSKINVINFSLEKIPQRLALPVIQCSENVITMSCSTTGAQIYYKLGQDASFTQYASPIEIFADTTVHAYSKVPTQTSEVVTETFKYDDGIEEPAITCDGEYIEIDCETMGADIYYRIGTSGAFIQYFDPFEITATVTVYSYATIDGKQSETVSEECTYVPVVLEDPAITCEDNIVVITCSTHRAEIYFRRNEIGQFELYEEPFEIEEDTLVEAYSTYKQQTSQTVSEECEYTPEHDYSKDYLTFKVLTPGTIMWRAVGGVSKTIEYSLNKGAWTSITSTADGVAINVVQGDSVRVRGSNSTYATSNTAYSAFGGQNAGDGGTATYDIEGNVMSLLYGDSFENVTDLTNTSYHFCSMFKYSGAVSAKNMILPALTLKTACYRALFSYATHLTEAPKLPATTLAQYCYWYMFQGTAISESPELNAQTLVTQCYGGMFSACGSIHKITCMAVNGFNANQALYGWVSNVPSTGQFIKSSSATSWTTGNHGIPTGWTVYNDMLLDPPEVFCDGETIELICATSDADIYYRLNQTGEFQLYTLPISIEEDTVIEAYSSYDVYTSTTVTETCQYVEETPLQRSNKTLPEWRYAGSTVSTPYSVNRIDGHSSKYAKGTFNFETTVSLKEVQPTYLWFQHADQSAEIYVDDVKVGTHWGGYNAFFFDITGYVHRGLNRIKVVLCNTTRTELAPCAGDFNFNATLGNVKLFTSPCLPAMKYGYDGFHITSNVTSSSATVNVKTTVPAGAQLVCTITNKDGYQWSDTKVSNGEEQTFTTVITGTNLHLWGGKPDPYLYNVKLEIYKDGDLYHRYERPYGLRYYSYVIDQPVNGQQYTGFLLNGQPYLLRGVCMHDDVVNKANALTDSDYDQEFAIIQELNCNFIRLAHYPHPKEVYDRCDQLGIIVQTEVPCVNKMQSTLPEDYFTHLEGQYTDMVQQHFNHPCIMFQSLSNETTTDDKAFAKQKIEAYYDLIRAIDPERMIGYVLAQAATSPAAYYNDPKMDWFGCNIYVGWYADKDKNDSSQQINTRLNNTLNRIGKPIAYSEYGCGGTQHCHSDDFKNTTTPGNYARHDIEYQMWLHEGHIATIRNFPQLLFTAQWQLFDIVVASRNEGYTECLDGVNTSINEELRRLNNKGLVERDHTTKKDTFYLYKAEWNTENKFVHICGKDYTKTVDRALKCYTNDVGPLSLYEGSSQTALETVQATNHIAQFTARTFSTGVEYRVVGVDASDSITFQASN